MPDPSLGTIRVDVYNIVDTGRPTTYTSTQTVYHGSTSKPTLSGKAATKLGVAAVVPNSSKTTATFTSSLVMGPKVGSITFHYRDSLGIDLQRTALGLPSRHADKPNVKPTGLSRPSAFSSTGAAGAGSRASAGAGASSSSAAGTSALAKRKAMEIAWDQDKSKPKASYFDLTQDDDDEGTGAGAAGGRRAKKAKKYKEWAVVTVRVCENNGMLESHAAHVPEEDVVEIPGHHDCWVMTLLENAGSMLMFDDDAPGEICWDCNGKRLWNRADVLATAQGSAEPLVIVGKSSREKFVRPQKIK